MSTPEESRPRQRVMLPTARPTDYNAELEETLLSYEIRWRDRQQYLESKGYMLRPRLRPGWVPSWKARGVHPMFCEDGALTPYRKHLIDATRMSDNKLVYIKRVATNDTESQIALMLNRGSLANDPQNHTVPILDMFEDDQDNTISYIVMPFLRLMDRPMFESVGEIVDFADQILEGLEFMHEHGVAHRDCSEKNLMMDGSAMYPLGFHPVNDVFLPDGETPMGDSYVPRSMAGVKYYFVDFGISSYVPRDAPSKLVLGVEGRDQDVPELSEVNPYDPFKVDVFTIGNVFRRLFYDKWTNVEFLLPLIESMTRADPSERPTASEARRQWATIRRGIPKFWELWRLKPRKESAVARLIFDTTTFVRVVWRWSNWLIGRH